MPIPTPVPARVISNARDTSTPRPHLPAERVEIFAPDGQWTYSHHPFLAHFKGRFYALWSNGRRDEDAPGQRVLLSTSLDFKTWSSPQVLAAPAQGRHSERVLTAAGFHQHDGELVAYFGSYEYAAHDLQNGERGREDSRHLDTTLFGVSTKDGETWSDAIDLQLPIVPNYPPQKTKSGRLLLAGNIAFPTTDDARGTSGWKMRGLFPDAMAAQIVDDSGTFHTINRDLGRPMGLCEAAWYQTADGVLHILLRSNTEVLWHSESHDDACSWSEPQPTEFSDNATKFHLGSLPDGRFYHVGSPDPEPRWKRNPLVLSLSEDGRAFDQAFILADAPYEIKYPGLHKGGDYGYPHSIIHEGALHVIFSLGKESVAALKVRV